jgi:hypothetical protein
MAKRPATPRRERDGGVETFERVLNKGVIVDRGSQRRRQDVTAGVLVTGNDVVGPQRDIVMRAPRRPRRSKP